MTYIYVKFSRFLGNSSPKMHKSRKRSRKREAFAPVQDEIADVLGEGELFMAGQGESKNCRRTHRKRAIYGPWRESVG